MDCWFLEDCEYNRGLSQNGLCVGACVWVCRGWGEGQVGWPTITAKVVIFYYDALIEHSHTKTCTHTHKQKALDQAYGINVLILS